MAPKTKPSCNKVKNPCKFCLEQVTAKTGLQCQGACKKWAHYKCLNYTPGKISDIKAGIIKVTCPCPDCETTQIKEYLTNPPFTCSNQQCPANKNPKCQSLECPSNLKKSKQSPERPVPAGDFPATGCTNSGCTNKKQICPNAPSNKQDEQKKPRMSPRRPPTPPRSTPRGKSPQSGSSARRSKPCFESQKNSNENNVMNSNKKSSNKKKSNKNNSRRGSPRESLTRIPCPSDCQVSDISLIKKKKPSSKKTPSSSTISCGSSACRILRFFSQRKSAPSSSSSGSTIESPRNQASMVQAIQEMCTTVGKLSVQLKELMCKMMPT